MKYAFYLVALITMIFGAYFSAQHQIENPMDIKALRLGMSAQELEAAFGTPSDKYRNRVTYVFGDSSQLIIDLRDGVASSARLKFHRPLKIEDPKVRRLTLVQMQSDASNRPSWFFAGKPEEGLIYKITAEGIVESITWVPPFSFEKTQPKHLQALLRDFKDQASKM